MCPAVFLFHGKETHTAWSWASQHFCSLWLLLPLCYDYLFSRKHYSLKRAIKRPTVSIYMYTGHLFFQLLVMNANKSLLLLLLFYKNTYNAHSLPCAYRTQCTGSKVWCPPKTEKKKKILSRGHGYMYMYSVALKMKIK